MPPDDPQTLDEDFRYGQLAIEGRLITPEQFDTAMDRVRAERKPLRDLLVADALVDAVTADRLAKALKRILRDERSKSDAGMMVKKQIGGYKLTRKIGEGGMGEVYLAEQLSMHRTVALKILHAKWSNDEEFRKRFLLEARAAGKLSHPNLIQVFDVSKYQGLYYFAMEFIDGVTVEDLIRHESKMKPDRVLDIALQVCEALRYLTANGIVHRDIKPANIMVTKDEVVKLGDFGFIQQSIYDEALMQDGQTIGTPDYISPEQARGERNLDVRSDIYSLGATMFHMLRGKTLYQGTVSQVMRAQVDTAPPDLDALNNDVPAPVSKLLRTMLEKDPKQRFADADALMKELELTKLALHSGPIRLPSSKSGILNVITAEKERLQQLDRQLASQRRLTWVAIVAALIGWIAALALAAIMVARA